MLSSSTLEARSLSLCDSAPPRWVPWLSFHSAAIPDHAPAPARCLCNHGHRGCGGTKACHMLSGQLRSLLEGRDMGERGTAECSSLTFSAVWEFLYSRSSGASHTWPQAAKPPEKVLLPLASLLSKNIKGLLTSSECCHGREFQIFTGSLYPDWCGPAQSCLGKNTCGCHCKEMWKGHWTPTGSTFICFFNSLRQSSQNCLLLLPPHLGHRVGGWRHVISDACDAHFRAKSCYHLCGLGSRGIFWEPATMAHVVELFKL